MEETRRFFCLRYFSKTKYKPAEKNSEQYFAKPSISVCHFRVFCGSFSSCILSGVEDLR